MISFLDLKSLNTQYRVKLIEVCTRVIDSSCYIHGYVCVCGRKCDEKLICDLRNEIH